MKTLLCIRSDYLTSFAGDSRQLLETAAFLRRHGADVQICTAADSIKKCDAVHLFNLTRITETYAFSSCGAVPKAHFADANLLGFKQVLSVYERRGTVGTVGIL